MIFFEGSMKCVFEFKYIGDMGLSTLSRCRSFMMTFLSEFDAKEFVANNYDYIYLFDMPYNGNVNMYYNSDRFSKPILNGYRYMIAKSDGSVFEQLMKGI
jgi:hypothetical protein